MFGRIQIRLKPLNIQQTDQIYMRFLVEAVKMRLKIPNSMSWNANTPKNETNKKYLKDLNNEWQNAKLSETCICAWIHE